MPLDVAREAELINNVKDHIDNYDTVAEEARKGVEMEHRMTLREGFRRYPKAMLWSVLLSTAV